MSASMISKPATSAEWSGGNSAVHGSFCHHSKNPSRNPLKGTEQVAKHKLQQAKPNQRQALIRHRKSNKCHRLLHYSIIQQTNIIMFFILSFYVLHQHWCTRSPIEFEEDPIIWWKLLAGKLVVSTNAINFDANNHHFKHSVLTSE